MSRVRTDPQAIGRAASTGVIALRLAAVASAGAIHLICGAGRVPFGATSPAPSIGLAPAIVALSWPGRPAAAHAAESVPLERADRPSVSPCLLFAIASGLRTFLLIRQFAPSVSGHRGRAEFGYALAGHRFGSRPTTCTPASARDGRHDPARVAAVIAELDADVVALQEFTYPASVALETRTPVVSTTLDRYECALGPTRQNRHACFGNALLTRHPIVEVHRIDLSMERREPRGALAATIDVGGAPLHVLAAHLGLRVHERRFQVRQILEYLDSVRDTLVVVLGDFNDWLPGRSVVHVLDRPSRPAATPAIVSRVRGPSSRSIASGFSRRRAATNLCACDTDGAARVGSLSGRRGDRRRHEGPADLLKHHGRVALRHKPHLDP